MDNNARRDAVRGFYPGQSWKARVDAMSDQQVFAIYMAKMEKGEPKPPYTQLQLKAEER